MQKRKNGGAGTLYSPAAREAHNAAKEANRKAEAERVANQQRIQAAKDQAAAIRAKRR